ELGISKKYLQNKISYEKKKQKLSIGNWKKISGKNTIVLSQKEQTLIKSWLDEADSLGDKQEDKADSLGGNQEDEEKSYLKERIFVLEKFLDKEQTSNSELKKIIQQTQNLLDQQQRLALQDKKLLEEYKAETKDLKALKMPPEDTRGGQAEYQYQPQEELERLKSENKSLQEQLNEQTTLEQHGVPIKWWQWWK
ncbi:hypothetical protein ABHA11_13890, partial [Enterococcus faecium]|nr:hypothetical protein [Enterococcus faecium]MDB7377901.1 hypothetical protein [Enterococcus faecium]MDB7380492.1 hypothetical protein [Enterococcus faecium]MDB7385621.1 hypothetical protein [Enterococcus faecium]MDB7388226.1 hypothetical protein [Enterococcus faecium]